MPGLSIEARSIAPDLPPVRSVGSAVQRAVASPGRQDAKGQLADPARGDHRLGSKKRIAVVA
jgi:hypothetical protein